MRIEQTPPSIQISYGNDGVSKYELASLADTVAQIGISAQEATSAMVHLSEILARLDVLEEAVGDLRSALDAKTENPNLKGDLEIFDRNEENPFLPNFIDLDSEDFIQQRPLWDFTVDF